MPNYLWNVTAIRNNGKVTKGMSVEIMKSNTNAKPSQKEIANALNNKYSAGISDGNCGLYVFSITPIK